MKAFLKKILKKSPIALSQNHAYDIQTNEVFKKILKPKSNCIDIGCHKGELMDLLLKYAPEGHHFGFEPLPHLHGKLVAKYADKDKLEFYNLALSDKKGWVKFNYVISNPAYSGIKKRKYDRANEKDEIIEVKTDLLDDIMKSKGQIDLIKIDVEGAELQVLNGATQLLKKSKPTVIFEHGLGAADCYGTRPEQIFDLLTSCELKISTMKRWLKGQTALSKQEFINHFEKEIDYYFMAYA